MRANTSLLAAALGCLIESASNPGDGSQLALDLESAREALAAYDAAPEPMVYTLAEIRNGTGFRRGSRFAVIRP